MRRAGSRHPDLLDSTGDVIAERGYAATRFSDVADSTGTSISTLQYLFGSRDDLLVAALRHRTDEFFAETVEYLEQVHDPKERLRETVRTFMTVDVDLAQARQSWLVWIEYWHTAMRDDELRKESVTAYARWRRILHDSIDALVATGAWRAPAHQREVVDSAVAMIDGYGLQIALGHRVNRAAASDLVLDYLWSSLQPAGSELRVRGKRGAVTALRR